MQKDHIYNYFFHDIFLFHSLFSSFVDNPFQQFELYVIRKSSFDMRIFFFFRNWKTIINQNIQKTGVHKVTCKVKEGEFDFSKYISSWHYSPCSALSMLHGVQNFKNNLCTIIVNYVIHQTYKFIININIIFFYKNQGKFK